MTKREKTALAWLAVQQWKASWWAGKPHGRWPREISEATLVRLGNQGFVQMLNCRDPFQRIVRITDAGRKALETTQ